MASTTSKSRSKGTKSTGESKARKKNVRQRRVITGIIFLAFGIFCAFALFSGETGKVGDFAGNVLKGFLGVGAYLCPVLFAYIGILLMINAKKSTVAFRIWTSVFCVIFVSAFTDYIKGVQDTGSNLVLSLYSGGISLQTGGLIGGLLDKAMQYLFGKTGTAIVLAAGILIFFVNQTGVTFAPLVDKIKGIFSKKEKTKAKQPQKDMPPEEEEEEVTQNEKKNNFNVNIPLSQAEPVKEEPIHTVFEQPQAPVFTMPDPPVIKQEAPIAKEEEKTEEAAINSSILPGAEGRYVYPPLTLLKKNPQKPNTDIKEELAKNGELLVETLKSFGVNTKIMQISRGPSVTRYELQPSAGVKVSRIVNLADDIALNLASPGVRIEAPIPGKAAVGIEVANEKISAVYLREVIESAEFKRESSKVSAALGRDITGKPIICDLSKMPHLLIAGATGSGKSVCINTILTSILYKATPEEVRLLLIDPKVVELGVYNGIPHLLIPVVTDPKKAAGALNWAVREMLNRYKLFADANVRDYKGYNEYVAQNEGEGKPLPQIVIVIDELADLMMAAPNEVEDMICRLAQMARAAGMHLVIATQRPSVDVITGIIKANIPSRISFSVTSQVDSRTILDMAGAEKLLGKGDMLYSPSGISKPIRVQGCFVSDKEVEGVVDFLKKSAAADYSDEILEHIEKDAQSQSNGAKGQGGSDELFYDAAEVVVDAGQASVSLLQRRLRLGYARAARIVDELEEKGIVGPYEGSKPRQVLISRQQFLEMKFAAQEKEGAVQ